MSRPAFGMASAKVHREEGFEPLALVRKSMNEKRRRVREPSSPVAQSCVCVWCVARPYLLSIAGYSIPSPQLCGAREQLFEGTDRVKKQKKNQAVTILHSVDRLLRPN